MFPGMREKMRASNIVNSLRFLVLMPCLCPALVLAREDGSRSIPTMSYERPVPIQANGELIRLEDHAVIR